MEEYTRNTGTGNFTGGLVLVTFQLISTPTHNLNTAKKGTTVLAESQQQHTQTRPAPKSRGKNEKKRRKPQPAESQVQSHSYE